MRHEAPDVPALEVGDDHVRAGGVQPVRDRAAGAGGAARDECCPAGDLHRFRG